MALIEWGEGYRIGIERIDSQHQNLVDSVNSFHAHRDHADQAEVADFIATLESYARDHFATEEALFEERRYPAADAHPTA